MSRVMGGVAMRTILSILCLIIFSETVSANSFDECMNAGSRESSEGVTISICKGAPARDLYRDAGRCPGDRKLPTTVVPDRMTKWGDEKCAGRCSVNWAGVVGECVICTSSSSLSCEKEIPNPNPPTNRVAPDLVDETPDLVDKVERLERRLNRVDDKIADIQRGIGTIERRINELFPQRPRSM